MDINPKEKRKVEEEIKFQISLSIQGILNFLQILPLSCWFLDVKRFLWVCCEFTTDVKRHLKSNTFQLPQFSIYFYMKNESINAHKLLSIHRWIDRRQLICTKKRPNIVHWNNIKISINQKCFTVVRRFYIWIL